MPALELMERAGAGVARAVERLAPDGPVAIVCGKGNNGGDGLVVARLLREAGREVDVRLHRAARRSFAGDARANLERLPGDGRCARRQLLGRSEPGAAPDRRSSGRGCDRRRAARHRLRGRAARRDRGGDRRDRTRRARRSSASTCRAASTPPRGDVAGAAVRRGRHRHLPRRQAGAVDQARARPTPASVEVARHRHPARRAGRRRRRADRRRACSRELPAAAAQPRRSSSRGHVLVAGGSRGLTGAPRDGRARGDARRRRLRHRVRARLAAADPRRRRHRPS